MEALLIGLVVVGFILLSLSGRKPAPAKQPKKAKGWKPSDVVTIQNPDGDKFEVLVTKEIKKPQTVKTDFLGMPVK